MDVVILLSMGVHYSRQQASDGDEQPSYSAFLLACGQLVLKNCATGEPGGTAVLGNQSYFSVDFVNVGCYPAPLIMAQIWRRPPLFLWSWREEDEQAAYLVAHASQL